MSMFLNFSSMAFKPTKIYLVGTGSQPYRKIMYSINFHVCSNFNQFCEPRCDKWRIKIFNFFLPNLKIKKYILNFFPFRFVYKSNLYMILKYAYFFLKLAMKRKSANCPFNAKSVANDCNNWENFPLKFNLNKLNWPQASFRESLHSHSHVREMREEGGASLP